MLARPKISKIYAALLMVLALLYLEAIFVFKLQIITSLLA